MTPRFLVPLVLVILASCNKAHAPRSVALATSAATPAPDCHDPSRTPSLELELGGTHLAFPTPYLPAQCYTRTRDDSGAVHNPCYTCHQDATAPNAVNDSDLQLEVSLPAPARDNPWTNLFVDRRRAAAEPSEAEVLAYVREDDYGIGRGGDRLKRRLADVPPGWDIDDDGAWDGYVPDASFRFDAQGFDLAPDGTPTGWRSFAYYPFLGTFFPTNGSTDDVLIRLPEAFRTNDAGAYDALVYETNLSVVEALIRRADVPVEPTDEARFGVDLDRDGHLGRATRIAYAWDPPRGIDMSFVGRARAEQRERRVVAVAGLFPLGTEFLHSVRYLDIVDGRTGMARRMKELRYARKTHFYGPGELEQRALLEASEDRDEPDRPREIAGNAEIGVSNGLGWSYQGFIEGADGELRPQTFEEHVACVGCHGGIGATTDGIFSFARKLGADAFQRGWSHPTQRDFRGVPDPLRADGRGEFATYLRVNGAGDELRANEEIRARFFDAHGAESPEAFAALERDIGTLLYPSPARAMNANRGYWAVVREQTFARGRDGTITPVTNVLRSVEEGATTGVEVAVPGPGILREPPSP